MIDRISKYHDAVRYVESFSNTSLLKKMSAENGAEKSGLKRDPDFFIKRTCFFLDLLGNPEKGFSYIHITGTAGKGTVSHMLQSVLTVSGKKTGLFTSPYVSTTIEKIQVDDLYINPNVFIDLVEFLKPYIHQAQKGPFGGPSAFEIFFAIALLYFKQEKCEWVVLEAGVGGRHDETNLISKPVVTAITNIDYDHTEILGKTLREIAFDKGGIIKQGSHFFTSEQRPQLQKIFKDICTNVGATFTAVGRQKNYSHYNSELVGAISRSLGMSDDDIKKGISQTRLPCRFETMQEHPLVVLDGAHNRAKIRSTIFNIGERFKKNSCKKLFLVIAIADTKKDHQAILEPLLSMSHPMHIVLTQVQTGERRSVNADVLKELSIPYKKDGDTIEIIEEAHNALSQVLEQAKSDDMVVVTGSFFLAGELRKKWFSEEWVMEHRRSFKSHML